MSNPTTKENSMIFIIGMAIAGGLVRVAAPHVRDFVASRELKKPGMRFIEAGIETHFIDGIWTPEEEPRVIAALQGRSDVQILAVGRERADAARKGGCPQCKNCKKLFPKGLPPVRCDRCSARNGTVLTVSKRRP